jgi:hypothetical protein
MVSQGNVVMQPVQGFELLEFYHNLFQMYVS